jgi:surface polysaccharide O-acyltransferase-like enzyme
MEKACLRGTHTTGNTLSQSTRLPISVDKIRTVAILGVLLLHASNDLTIQQMNTLQVLEIFRWFTVDIYQSIGRVGVPLFVMLTGALLLQPSKVESLNVFFKKRVVRIGIPFLFWGVVYFAWDFLVEQQAFTSSALIQGVLTGPYFQFWYIYMLFGLYLLTPFLRLMVAHANRSLFKYFIVLWLIGSAFAPLLAQFTPYYLDGNLLTIPGYVGYFVLGLYLLNVKVKRSQLVIFMFVGFSLTVIGTYVMSGIVGGSKSWTFQEYLSPTMILASISLFLLLNTLKTSQNTDALDQETDPKESASSKSKQSAEGKLLRMISENTLPIFLFHEMVLYSLQRGYLGITINGNTINSIIGIPLISVITLFICLTVLVPLKKIPFLKLLIG